MTNYEYYKDEIMAIIEDGYSLAVNKNTEKPCACQDILCGECLLWRDIMPCTSASCRHNRKKWLNSEYKPVAPTITVDEKSLLAMLNKNAWIARDSKEADNSLFIYLAKPIKVQISWAISEARNYAGLVFDLKNPMFRDLTILNYDNINFDFIKWEDKEPWQVKDLLNLEVK